MVRMWPATCLLRFWSMDASVVLLPVPVAPTISTSPRLARHSVFSISGRLSESSAGISVGMKRKTAAMESRCLKPESRKVPTPLMWTPMFSSPVSSSSSICAAVITSPSSMRGWLGARGSCVSCRIWPWILMSTGMLADRKTSDARFSAISRRMRSMFLVLIVPPNVLVMVFSRAAGR
ncbi:MAG: hypothetical protein RJB37_710 [Pseudomonadota bacterium]